MFAIGRRSPITPDNGIEMLQLRLPPVDGRACGAAPSPRITGLKLTGLEYVNVKLVAGAAPSPRITGLKSVISALAGWRIIGAQPHHPG